MNPNDDSLNKNEDDDATSNVDEPKSDDAEGSTSAHDLPASFRQLLPAGFAQSVLPKISIKPFSAAAFGFKYESPVNALAKKVQESFAPWEKLGQQVRSMFEPFADLPRLMLPPNLRSVSEDISAVDVFDFLEEEGIPLYLIPRAAIGRRLVLAKDHASRRKVLNDRFTEIVDDCAALLGGCSNPIVATEVHFIWDGIGALRAGHYAAAQAIFTVTLDTLIARLYPDRNERKQITNRKKGAPMPDEISDMGVRAAYVWLPVWNAHQQYWQHKGDRIPNDYSRHATVHGVSKAQFNKRNCVQSLMLASSLIGYAEQLARAAVDSAKDDQ